MKLGLIFFAAVCVCEAAFLSSQIPLGVSSILPGDLDDPRIVHELSLKAPITVVFTRPVISFGSDWGNPLTQAPFEFVDESGAILNIPGRIYCPTTFIVRFDPEDEWPSDLSLTVRLRSSFRSYDGLKLQRLPQIRFTTPPLTMNLESVVSPRAAAMTENAWNAFTAGEAGYPECPSDCTLTVRFSHPVSVELIAQQMSITSPVQSPFPTTLHAPSFTVSACPPPNQSHPAVVSNSSLRVGNLTKCVKVVPSNLQVGDKYNLVLPKGQ